MGTKKLLISLLFFLGLFWGHSSLAIETLPIELNDVGISEKLGAQISLDTLVVTEKGQTVPLNTVVSSDKPTILAFMYYNCPMLCHLIAGGLTDSLNAVKLKMGTDFQVVSLSIDPKDTKETAENFSQKYYHKLSNTIDKTAWKFLTAPKDTIEKLTSELGFQYRYNPETAQYAHPSALMILSPSGMITRYLYGIEFNPFDLKMALIESKENKVKSTVERVLLFCYNYDPQSRGYVLYAVNLMRAAGVVTVLAIILAWVVLSRSRRQTPQNSTEGKT